MRVSTIGGIVILTVICSWCKKVMKQGDAPPEAPVSHSCCDACLKKYFPLICDDIIKGSKESA